MGTKAVWMAALICPRSPSDTDNFMGVREWMEEEAPSTADSKPAVRRGDVGSPVGSAVYSYVSSYLSFRTAESR